MTSDYERLFVDNLELIEEIIGAISRRKCCLGQDAEDFASTAKLKLIDNDYAVLRKFQGKSTLKTYLTTVLHNIFRDYRVHEWGRWRPSAMAKRLGPEAVQLETLMYRDGYSQEESVEVLKTNFHVETDRAELETMAAELPSRTQRRFEGEDGLRHAAADGGTDARVLDAELSLASAQIEEHLDSALQALTPKERLILRMRYEDSFTVAQIADALNLEPRPLYRRFERCLGKLRKELEDRNVSADEAMKLVGWERFELKIDFGGTEEGNS